jgi:maleate cis-trans isomerase
MKTTVGVLYPGYSAEDDYLVLERMLGDVSFRVQHTDIGEDAHRVDALLEMGSSARLAVGAEALRQHRVGSVVWGCTSGSFVFGWDGARAQAAAVGEQLGVPASSTSLAFAEAATALGLRRVAVAATYPDDVAEAFVDFLGHAGLTVVGMQSHGIVTAAEVGTLARAEVVGVATSGDHPDAEAVLLPDTALHTAAWLDELQAAVGKPVLTANQVTAWHGLRLAGDRRQHVALGPLGRTAPSAGAVSPGPAGARTVGR